VTFNVNNNSISALLDRFSNAAARISTRSIITSQVLTPCLIPEYRLTKVLNLFSANGTRSLLGLGMEPTFVPSVTIPSTTSAVIRSSPETPVLLFGVFASMPFIQLAFKSALTKHKTTVPVPVALFVVKNGISKKTRLNRNVNVFNQNRLELLI